MQLKSNIPISKINCYIHFAVKAGKVLWGIDNLTRNTKKQVRIVLYDESIASNSKKVLDKYLSEKNVPSLQVPENYLNDLLLRENVKVIAILDESLGNAIINNCE